VREAVSGRLEHLRAAGKIGSSLNAEVDLYCGPDLLQDLQKLEDELRFVFISSYATVHPLDQKPEAAHPVEELDDLLIEVRPSAHVKCERCWHQREDVGSDAAHPGLCSRCAGNITGHPEPRSHA
jgi:isoleucyl-tRNA synthetase